MTVTTTTPVCTYDLEFTEGDYAVSTPSILNIPSGGGPYVQDMKFSTNYDLLFVLYRGGGTDYPARVLVVDVASNNNTDTITDTENCFLNPQSMVPSRPNDAILYITDDTNHNIVRLDRTTGDCSEVKNLDFCYSYRQIDISQNGQYMIICCSTSNPNVRCMEFSDPSTNYTTPTWDVTIGVFNGGSTNQPKGLLYAPDNSKAYILMAEWLGGNGWSAVIELDISSNRLSVSVSQLTHDTDTDPRKIAIDPSGDFLFFVRPHDVQKIEINNPTITFVAGHAQNSGNVDGLGNSVRFNYPTAIAMQDTGTLWIGEENEQQFRHIQAGSVTMHENCVYTTNTTTTTTTPAPTTTTTTPVPTTTTTTPVPTTTSTTPSPTNTTTTPEQTPNSTTTTPKSVLANTLRYGTRCPLNSVTLGAGKNRLRDCLCEENYFLNESGFCVACAYGYRKEEIGNFNCSCYVFDTCDPPVCNGDGSSCRPLLVTSEEEGGEFGLSEVLLGDFDDTSLTNTFDLDVEVAKQGFEFTSDGSELISSTSIVKSEVVNGTKVTSVTNVIMRQNRLTNEVEIKILPIQNEVIKATAVSSSDDKVLIFATEHRVVLYDENSEQMENVSAIDENEQIVDVATLNDKEELITIAYSVGILNASSSRRRLLQDETSDFCGKVNYLKRSIKRSIPTSTYKVCDPHSVALYTSDKNKDYIVVGTPCRIVSIDLYKNSIKTLVGPGEPHEKCQESDFGSKDGNFDEIRFQDASKILVDDTGSEIFVFDDNRLRKIAITENTVSGITTVDTFDDDEIDSITNMAISPQDGTILFAQNQEIKLTVNASDSAIDTQQTRLDNKIKRLDLVKPKESKHGLYCFSEENKQNAEVTCNPNQDDVERGLLCRNGVPCVCLNGYYLKNNKCVKCRVEDV